MKFGELTCLTVGCGYVMWFSLETVTVSFMLVHLVVSKSIMTSNWTLKYVTLAYTVCDDVISPFTFCTLSF